MKTWGEIYRSAIKCGYDHGYAAHLANMYELRKQKKPKLKTPHEWTQRLQPGTTAHPTPLTPGMPALPDMDDRLLDNDGAVYNPSRVEPVENN